MSGRLKTTHPHPFPHHRLHVSRPPGSVACAKIRGIYMKMARGSCISTVALLTIFWSGCISNPDAGPNGFSGDPQESDPSGDQTDTLISIYHASRHPVLAIPGGRPIIGSESGGFILGFNTTQNTTAILFEVAWNDTIQDLDTKLYLNVPFPCEPSFTITCIVDEVPQIALHVAGMRPGQFQNTNGAVGLPDNPSRILVEKEQLLELMPLCKDECEWSAGSAAKGPYIDLEWHAFVTVFDGMEIPEGYTAIPWL